MGEAAEQQWIHRATWPDGRVEETEPRTVRLGQPCFAGITQLLMQRSNPGVVVVHLVGDGDGDGDGEWA